MASARAYPLIDEPRPSPLANLGVAPLWPLLATMFAGSLFAWLWFAVNGLAIGSPTRTKEWLVAGGGLAGSALLVFGLLQLGAMGVIPRPAIPYLLIGLTVWKLAVSYWLYALQSAPFALYQHFGGQARNGLMVLVATALLAGYLGASQQGLWKLVELVVR